VELANGMLKSQEMQQDMDKGLKYLENKR